MNDPLGPAGQGPRRAPTPSRIPAPLWLGAAVLAGIAIPAQGRINGALGLRLGDGLAAALTSFGTGLVVLVALTALVPSLRASARGILPAVREGRIPWWYLGAGLLGALFVLGQAATVGVLGIAVFTIAAVTGQTVSGLLVDRVGFAQGRVRRITGMRAIATVLTLVSVAYAVTPKLGTGIDPLLLAVLVLLPFAGGFGQSFQSAMNGASGTAYGNPLTATLVNFVSGTSGLALVWGVKAVVAGPARPLPGDFPADWWYYLGGPLGIVFIAAATVLVRHLGVLLTGLGMIAGQLLGSLALDVVVPAPGSVVALPTVIGTVATLGAMVLATLPWNRRLLRAR
ncbi:DMT family transporter [Sinomonas halotolerans]|uniref:DMT family transporter n=1 Tax=Sinomonas halotolerans TaxID=1644133 RepID=A0ABU9WY05_9MICC